MLAVELRAEETRCSLQNLIGALEFSYLLLELFNPRRLRGGHPGRVPVVDVGLAHPGAHRLDPVAELTGNTVPCSVPNPERNARTIRTAAAFSSGLYLRLVGLPGDCSFGIPCTLVSKVRSLRDFQGDSHRYCAGVACA